MGKLEIGDLIKDGQIAELKELDATLAALLKTYTMVATELAKGIKMEVNSPKDLEKLYALYTTQTSNANKVSVELNATLDKQKQVLQDVADSLQKKVAAGELSAKDMKTLTDASSKNAAALEKIAKAELSATKVQTAGNSARKNAKLSEEERLKVIKSAIELTNQEIHSRAQAKEVNKQLQKAVDVLKDTDEDYIRTLARLNSTIGVNTDYVKRNSDRYTKQKMTIGAYREEVKAAMIELQNGNKSLNNLGIAAKGFGGILKTSVVNGMNEVTSSVGNMIKGFIGAQAIINGFQRLIGLFQSGFQSVIDFEAANSKLAAILGTTSKNVKDLTIDAQRLGAATKYTASEATNLQIELAKLGFSKTEILQSTEYVLKFAQATGSELPEAAALAGASLRMFNADTSETERYVSAMAVATTKSALSFSYLQTAMPIVGPVAKAFNFTIEDTLTLLGKLSDAGFDASMAATATRNILLNLADSSGKLATALGGPVKSLPELVAGLKKLQEQNVDLATTLELTDKRSVSQFNTFLRVADSILPLREQITGVSKELGDMAKTMDDNVQGAIFGLSSAWEAFMLSIVKSKGAIKDVIDSIADWLRNLAFEGMSGEEDVLGMETKLKKDAEALARGDVEKAQEDFNKRMKDLKAQGLSDDEAYIKAVEEISKKKIDISVKEQKEIASSRERALIKEQNWKDDMNKGWGYINNKFANVFRYTTSTANEADKAMTAYARNYTEYMKSLSFNSGIDKIIDSAKPKQDESSTQIKTKEQLEKEKRALEKAAKERQRILETMQQSDLDLMDEGLQKELAKIAFSYNKKIAAVRGNSEEEQKTRENLAKKMQQDLGDYEVDFYLKKEQERIQNKLAVVKKGSDEEYKLQLSLLDIQEEVEKESAIRKNEDILSIEEKYAKKRQEILEEQSGARIKAISENAAAEQVALNQQYQKNMLDLKKQFAQKGNNVTDKDKEDYEEKQYQITKEYALKSAEAAIDALEMELAASTEGSDERSRIAEELQNKRAELANKAAELEIEAIERVTEKDDEAKKKRMRNLQDWLQLASDAVGSIGDLIGTLYDGKIAKIEDEQDANEEAKEKDIERIENLAETGAISEEEAEARKRAAEEKTAAKNAELEKKKQAMAKKQAVWDKATSIAQAGIATALAITKALPNFILAAIVGAMGAIQVATIAATPIPSYAEGTKDGFHPGGKALVGDAGKREVVMYNGLAWVTPDTPMVVDLPRGAKVFPDVDEMETLDWNSMNSEISFANHKFMGSKQDIERTTVINDFSRLERKMDENNKLLAQGIKQQRKYDADRDFELYKLKKL